MIFTFIDHLANNEEIRKAAKIERKGTWTCRDLSSVWKAIAKNDKIFEILKFVVIEFWEKETPPEELNICLLKILPKKET